MISYTVKRGDTLSELSYKYQTTVGIIMEDNPIIKNKNVLSVGWTLKIRTSSEYAKDKAKKAAAAKNSASSSKSIIMPVDVKVSPNASGPVLSETGVVRFKRNASIYKFLSNGALKAVKGVSKDDSFKAYGYTPKQSGLYVLGGSQYAKKADVVFTQASAIPTVGESARMTLPKTDTAASVRNISPSNFSVPEFSMPGYRRPILQVKKPDGKYVTMEMRVFSVGTNHSNQIQPNQTNAGWMVNVGGKNLSTLSVSGVFLDTASNREADDFIENYHDYLTPMSSDDYYRSALSTFVYKNREYKGLIANLTISDQSDNPLDRKFTMQYMVLKEKGLTSTNFKAQYMDKIIDRKGQDEVEFLSDIKNMLANPITGTLAGN